VQVDGPGGRQDVWTYSGNSGGLETDGARTVDLGDGWALEYRLPPSGCWAQVVRS
jgi:hypothetical protein